MNVSEYIFKFFEEKEINKAFMITGGQAMFLNDAIGKNKSYDIICCHHEQATTMAADAYGRIKNKPAIALVTAGPGSVNAMNGVVGGYTDSAPMIVISGQSALSCVKYQAESGIRQYGIQGIYIKPLVEKAVKYFVTIDDVKKLKYYLEKAYQEAVTGRPGPVWIDVPLDIQKSQVNEMEFISCEIEKKSTMKNIDSTLDMIIEKLEKAERPLLIVGQGVALAKAREDFRAFITKVQIPVITSRLGIDLIESDNDLYIGRLGNYGERSANIAIQRADFILCIGTRLSSATVGHSPQKFGRNAYKVVVDIDQKELDKPGVNIDYKLKCCAKTFLSKINTKLENQKIKYNPDWNNRCLQWKNKYPVMQEEYTQLKELNSYYFVDELTKQAGSDANVLVDTGSCFHVACQGWKVKKGQNFLTTGGLSSMGYWCAAIGACVANDNKETIVITGDGSLQMNIQEFATIKHNKLPIKVFILNNNGYLLIRQTQRNFMDDRFVGEGPDSGVWCPDSLEIAKAYGIKGVRIDDSSQVKEKIKEVLAYDGPVICDVMTPEWQLIIPRITSDKLPDGTLVSKEYDDMFPFLDRDEYENLMK